MRPAWVGTAGLYRPRRIKRAVDAAPRWIKPAIDVVKGAFSDPRPLKAAITAWTEIYGAQPPSIAALAATDMLKGRAVDLANPADRRSAIALAAAATALARGRVHVACFSDGMAAAAHEAASDLFGHIGISHALVGRRDDLATRRTAYAAAIVYVSSRRLAQDGLLDAEALGGAVTTDRARVRRLAETGDDAAPILGPGAAAAFVDDADLTILGAGAPASLGADPDHQEGKRLATEAFAIVSALRQPRHYAIDPITRRIRLTELGAERAASFAVAFGAPWTARNWREETVLAALAIRDLYEFGRNYSLEDGRIVLAGSGDGGSALTETPSIPDLIAAKEGLEVAAPGARQTSLPRWFSRYPHLGATGVNLWTARRELQASLGLSVTRRCPGVRALEVEAFADFAGKRARLKHLSDEGWTLWAPTDADAEQLQDLGAEIIVGAALLERPPTDAKCLQAAAAAPQVEIRFAAQNPSTGAVISAEDRYFEPIETPLLERIREGEVAMTPDAYRKLQTQREAFAADQRAKQANADAYFDAVMAFAGDDL